MFKGLKLLGLSLFTAALSAGADTLNITGNTLDLIGVDTTSISYSDALVTPFTMPHAGKALVISSFSSSIGKGAKEDGFWQLKVGAATSLPLVRHQEGSSDKGVGSVVHIFDNLAAGGHTLSLQHRIDQNKKPLTTFGVNNVVIPLVTDAGVALNSSLTTMSSVVDNVGTSFTDVMSGSISLPNPLANVMLVAAALDCTSSGAATGEWQIQYRTSGAASWVDLGKPAQRAISSTVDNGIVMVYALAESLPQGTYDVRLAAKSNTVGQTLSNSNGTMAVAVLSYESGGNPYYFPSYFITSDGDTYNGSGSSTIQGAVIPITLPSDSSVFTAMSFGGAASVGSNQTGQFEVSILQNSTVVQLTQPNQRQFASTSDQAAMGAVGVLSALSAGDYSLEGRHDPVAGQILTNNVNLLAVVTESQLYLPTAAIGFEMNYNGEAVVWRVAEELGVKAYIVSYSVNGNWVEYERVAAQGLAEYQSDAPESSAYRITVVNSDGSTRVHSLNDAGRVSIELNLDKGWNLLSVPYENADLSALGGQLWGWKEDHYILMDTPVAKQGLWYFSSSKQNLSVSGYRSEDKTVSVNSGWSLVGPVDTDMKIPDGVTAFEWKDSSYVEKEPSLDALELGSGYFIFSENSTVIK